MWIHLLWSQRPWPYVKHTLKGHYLHLNKGKTHKWNKCLESNDRELNLKKFQVTFNSSFQNKTMFLITFCAFSYQLQTTTPFSKTVRDTHTHSCPALWICLSGNVSQPFFQVLVISGASVPSFHPQALHSRNSGLRGNCENSNSLPFFPCSGGEGGERGEGWGEVVGSAGNCPVCWGQREQ